MKANCIGSRFLVCASGWALGLALLALMPRAAAAATSGDANSSLIGPSQTVDLEYRELSNSIVNWGLVLSTQKEHFGKEPAVTPTASVRGKLFENLGADQALPILWDSGQGKLYLDLNRNGDLTDDPEGVFTTSRPLRSSYQIFNNIHLLLKTSSGNHPVLVDLDLYSYSSSSGGAVSAGISVSCHSLWEGKISLQGHDYQIGLVETLNGAQAAPLDVGYIVLRPWEKRAEYFNVGDGSLVGFAFSRNFFFNAQGYRLGYSYLPQTSAPKYRLEIEQRNPELGELRLTGKFISRLVLNPEPGRAGFTVVLDDPESTVKVPIGVYNQRQLVMQAGLTKAGPIQNTTQDTPRSLTVEAARPAQLADGGPLTNTVKLSRNGALLTLNYRLVGADGQAYRLLGLRKEPDFVIHRGERQVALGKFEFG